MSGRIPDSFIELYSGSINSNLFDFTKDDKTRLKERREGLELALSMRLRTDTASSMAPDLQCNLMRKSESISSLGGTEGKEEGEGLKLRRRNLEENLVAGRIILKIAGI